MRDQLLYHKMFETRLEGGCVYTAVKDTLLHGPPWIG